MFKYKNAAQDKNTQHHQKPSENLVWRDAVELWQQPYPVFLFDQDALQSLLVLLNLDELTEVAANSSFTKQEYKLTH